MVGPHVHAALVLRERAAGLYEAGHPGQLGMLFARRLGDQAGAGPEGGVEVVEGPGPLDDSG
jgi:hypothetical protein